ncbi:peroxisomal d3,d2-enoyl-CoA isomeras-like protein [Gonapodya prolifera JEL478]|uniref:Peroxisomal d3,d2-enoyl-CoA isomeras-like protein n=1 Tax=Gonapodya prolifera (strain JEL478) TaxID=1344416 RepID=A0A139AYN1_GONPJ|nr:peroxisomal d3,d2-enoyl-CoA isomeras-like protein [Gonapodya prolifera JEL478]|eukprot:KXS21565.1 peroxisomal d3,d2-enoyl-CoA isomeras-like protein [Gonapodya prolifera JEL478]
MANGSYKDLLVTVSGDGKIGYIKINRPGSLNSLTPDTNLEFARALADLSAHPTTVVTVLTGVGRFFSSGADVRASRAVPDLPTDVEKKVSRYSAFASTVEYQRQLIHHPKLLVIALNGPAVGVAAAWTGFADILLVSDSATLHVPFSSLGLVPEAGAGVAFVQGMGLRLATEVLTLGRKLTASELISSGFANRVFPSATFEADVEKYLEDALKENDEGSVLVGKKLIAQPLIPSRMAAVTEANNELMERYLTGVPAKRFQAKAAELAAKRKSKGKL